MDHRIIKYYAGELSKEERKALLQEAFSNQELKKEMINCQHLQSLVKLHPQEKNELLGKESLKRFMKARQIEKKKRLSFHFLRYAAIIIACIVSTWWVTYSFISMDIPACHSETLCPGRTTRTYCTAGRQQSMGECRFHPHLSFHIR